jgi:uncharacterized protein YprB with RNaseH-like and TPR domain
MWGQDIHYDNILQEWFIICVAWKWLGQKTIHGAAIEKPCEDKEVIQKVHDVISSADAIIGHNGDKFDLKKFNARAIIHGIPPLPPIIQIDTLKMARSKFKFNTNRLDYIGEILGVGRKVETKKGLWLRVLKGEKKAIKEMLRYNKGDVQLLEDVYNKLKPYCPSKLNMNLFKDSESDCPSCGSDNTQKRGWNASKTNRKQRRQCMECGHWYSNPEKSVAR